jgi:hypothetical protein
MITYCITEGVLCRMPMIFACQRSPFIARESYIKHILSALRIVSFATKFHRFHHSIWTFELVHIRLPDVAFVFSLFLSLTCKTSPIQIIHVIDASVLRPERANTT